VSYPKLDAKYPDGFIVRIPISTKNAVISGKTMQTGLGREETKNEKRELKRPTPV